MDNIEELLRALPSHIENVKHEDGEYTAWFQMEKFGSGEYPSFNVVYMEWGKDMKLGDCRQLFSVDGNDLTEILFNMLCKVKAYRDEHKDI